MNLRVAAFTLFTAVAPALANPVYYSDGVAHQRAIPLNAHVIGGQREGRPGTGAPEPNPYFTLGLALVGLSLIKRRDI